MQKVLFVYNPVSGKGLVKKKMFDIVSFYNENDCTVTMCTVREFEKLVSEGMKLEDFDKIVVSGGDGTLNNFRTYCEDLGYKGAVSYVPSGSTNDYAATLGIPKEFDEAIKNTLKDDERKIDIGDFNGNPFLYVAGFGIFTSVVYTTPQALKNKLGYHAYILESAKQFFNLKSYGLKLSLDGKEYEGEFWLGLISNSSSIGGMSNKGGMDVELDDGLFEVFFIRKPKNLAELVVLLDAYWKGKPERSGNIITAQVSHVSIDFNEKIDWTLDGEFGGAVDHVDITVKNKEFKISV